MATVIERNVPSDTGNSSAMTMIVALVALVLVVGVALYAFRLLPFAGTANTSGSTANPIHADVNGQAPAATAPSGQK